MQYYSSYLNGEVQSFRFRESVVGRQQQIRLYLILIRKAVIFIY
ncbi:hypothetical protein NIES3807_32550 [Microcystis aeruginosa NIES-3807]|uniref:Uncharacterized protein n=1 Tax=Microcystis aeruginosa NIES-3807 TaxID=2517785 RepID=A0AAD3B2R6_MICAE|nr:hypothetical protein NIES3807_32550 [Microcystis aeruginosa NIES-3807]